MPVNRLALAVALFASGLVAPVARGEGDASATKSAPPPPGPDDLDLRLTLSSFLYRQSGSDGGAFVPGGGVPENASPVHRFFGDLRLELTDEGLAVDTRVRQTTSARYQSGADGGGEYELRTLSYRIGSPHTHLTLGRQFIDAVGATKVDGLAFGQQLADPVVATLFAGAFPALGSRSVDTDYADIRNADGTAGGLLIPLTAGLGITYQTATIHGDLGLAGVYVAQDVPTAPAEDKTRVFVASSGYWRPSTEIDVYHFVLADVAGGTGANLTNGSLGLDGHPAKAIQLTAAFNHVSTDLLQIAARNFLEDPDPSAQGVVQNNVALLRVSQDTARGAASVALARRRFELTLGGGYHRRPAVSVALSDGTGAVVFPESRTADVTMSVLDRRSIAGTRIAVSASLTDPIGAKAPTWSHGTIVRATVGKTFAEDRGQIEADVMVESVQDQGGGSPCVRVDPLACYGTSDTTAAQTGVLASWRVGREWLLVADTHVGYQQVGSHVIVPMDINDPASPLIDLPVTWPRVLSITGFVRLQWRYR
jgi:hypothetical protein